MRFGVFVAVEKARPRSFFVTRERLDHVKQGLEPLLMCPSGFHILGE